MLELLFSLLTVPLRVAPVALTPLAAVVLTTGASCVVVKVSTDP